MGRENGEQQHSWIERTENNLLKPSTKAEQLRGILSTGAQAAVGLGVWVATEIAGYQAAISIQEALQIQNLPLKLIMELGYLLILPSITTWIALRRMKFGSPRQERQGVDPDSY